MFFFKNISEWFFNIWMILTPWYFYEYIIQIICNKLNRVIISYLITLLTLIFIIASSSRILLWVDCNKWIFGDTILLFTFNVISTVVEIAHFNVWYLKLLTFYGKKNYTWYEDCLKSISSTAHFNTKFKIFGVSKFVRKPINSN